jgi:hypothetical protein
VLPCLNERDAVGLCVDQAIASMRASGIVAKCSSSTTDRPTGRPKLRQPLPFLHRFVGTPVITFLTSRACGHKLTNDSQTGYRAFRRDQMLDLALVGNGMELASEMLIKSARADLRIGNMEGGYSPRVVVGRPYWSTATSIRARRHRGRLSGVID